MKKIISLVMCAVMLLCCGSFAGCSSQSSKESSKRLSDDSYVDPSEVRAEDIKKALINAGYTEAYIPESEASFSEDLKTVYLDKSSIGYVLGGGLGGPGCPEFAFNETRDDIPEILDAVMPLFDKDFKQGDGEKIVEKLKSSRSIEEDGDIYCQRVPFKNYEYKEYYDGDYTYVKNIQLFSL